MEKKVSTYEGVCQGCGLVQSVIASNQEEANKIITKHCECEESERLEEYEMLMFNIKQVLQNGCEMYGFSPVDLETVSRVEECAKLIWKGSIGKAAFDIEDTTVEIKRTAKNIKVSRKKTKKINLET